MCPTQSRAKSHIPISRLIRLWLAKQQQEVTTTLPSIATRISSVGTKRYFVTALLAAENPARDFVAGFQLHPPFLHAQLGDIDVALSLVSEAAGAFERDVLVVLRKRDTLAPEGY